MPLDYRQRQYVDVFRVIARSGAVGATRADIVAHMGVSLRTVGALADEMMAKGYICGRVRKGEKHSPWRYYMNHPAIMEKVGE